tara:strand:+ start:1120 stop:1317 length:198 start_codon:yes stop_codon:yes gene_type:complete
MAEDRLKDLNPRELEPIVNPKREEILWRHEGESRDEDLRQMHENYKLSEFMAGYPSEENSPYRKE